MNEPHGALAPGPFDAAVIAVTSRLPVPFFKTVPESLWPRFLIVEDSHELWHVDLFSELRTRGYKVSAHTKLNVMMDR